MTSLQKLSVKHSQIKVVSPVSDLEFSVIFQKIYLVKAQDF